MKSVFSLLVVLLTALIPAIASAQTQQPTPTQTALQIDNVINQWAQTLEALQKQNADLQREIADLKAKYEPPKKEEPEEMTATPSNRFLACLPCTLAQEAPYPSTWGNPRNFSNDPGDPGGKTMDGIIQVEYDKYRTQHGLPRQDVRLISETEGDDIYLNNYWLPYCPDLPVGLDMMFFDSAVNEGTGEAVKIFQFSLGTPSDGKWGPKTETLVKAIADVPAAIRAFGARRAAVYKGTRGFTRFGKDWERRDSEITAASLKMVA